MAQQERDRRGPEPGGHAQEPRHLAAEKIFAGEARAAAKSERVQVRPGFRERVEALMGPHLREPFVALRLSDNGLRFDVPGRRLDGTVKGKGLVLRFFWNILRGIGKAAVFVFALLNWSGSGGGKAEQEFHVKGPANAMALDLADRLRPAKGPWLVYSPSSLTVVDTGSTFADPAAAPAPQIVWQARQPQAPRVDPGRRTITWPDGSSFTFTLHGRTEDQHLRAYLANLR